MKLRSIRDIDLDDSIILVNQLKIEDPLELYHLMCEISPDVNLSSILKVFTKIHGAEWFAKYYKEHAENILEIFNSEGRK